MPPADPNRPGSSGEQNGEPDGLLPLRCAPGRPPGRTGARRISAARAAGAPACGSGSIAASEREPARLAGALVPRPGHPTRCGSGRAAPRALVVAADLRVRQLVRRRLRAGGFAVITTDDGLHAVMLAHEDPPDLIIVADVVGGLGAVHLLRCLRQDPRTADVPTFVLVSSGPRRWRVTSVGRRTERASVGLALGEVF